MGGKALWLVIILLLVFLFLCYKGSTLHFPMHGEGSEQ
jgi:hypothetical protein